MLGNYIERVWTVLVSMRTCTVLEFMRIGLDCTLEYSLGWTREYRERILITLEGIGKGFGLY